jgi:hypothetical protein
LPDAGFVVTFYLHRSLEDLDVATQPVHEQKDFQQPAPPQKDASWRILAEEAAREKDPQKLMEIISALTKALEEANSGK